MKIYDNVSQLVGGTPLLRLNNLFGDSQAEILAKLEYLNPAGSVKDRIAVAMLDDAEKRHFIKDGATIIEPTSGNTGIGLASVGASRGYKVILTMPDTMSSERISLLKAYGAEVVLTDGREGMKGAIDKARKLSDEIDGSYIPSQFDNPSNPSAHMSTTGPEIWNDTDGKIDYFVACVGSGGTLSGIATYLKSMNNNIKTVAVEPETSAVISGGKAGSHGIQGIGAGFIPDNLNVSIIDEVITVNDDDAYNMGALVPKIEGILVGISSGAALVAAAKIANRDENKGKTIVVLLPDTGDRYLSTSLFDR